MPAFTPRTNLYKPGGGSSGTIPDEVVDIDKINDNSDIIDASLGAPRVTSATRPATPFDGQTIYESDTNNLMVRRSDISQWVPPSTILKVADFAALAALSTTPFVAGDLVYVGEGAVYMRRTAGGWAQATEATFATAADRDTAYAKASAAYLVDGARSVLTSGLVAQHEWVYRGGWTLANGRVLVRPAAVSTGSGTINILASGAVSFTESSSVNISTCFSTEFRHYEVLVTILSATSAADIQLRLGNALNPVATNAYITNVVTASGTTVAGTTTAAVAQGTIGRVAQTFGGAARATITNPAGTDTTFFTSESYDTDNTQRRNGGYVSAAAYASLFLFPSAGNFTGEVRVYGLSG